MKSRYLGRSESVHKRKVKTGVLLTNLGTPEEPTPTALKRYLREFLSDPRVVEIPRILWMFILHGIILQVRPKKSAKLYASIWKEDGSPLLVNTRNIVKKVKASFGENESVVVDMAMRYGAPSIADALNRFQENGVDNIIVLPLYPQFSGPTTASTFDEVTKTLSGWRWIPSLKFISTYHDDSLYIQALAKSIKEHIEANGMPDRLIFSYHGMPKHFFDNGDPYYCFCHKTTRLVVEELGLSEQQFIMTFQSRFGKAEWLKPYTDATLVELANEGIKHVAVVSPAFSADCLETLEELVHENKDEFIGAGGETYHYIPALNDRDDHCLALTEIINRELP